MRRLISAVEAAILLALCKKRKEEDSGKEFPRIRISEKTLKRVTGRRRLDGRFITDLNEALLDYNLALVFTGDAIGLVQASSIKGWTRLNSSWVRDEIRQVRRGEFDVADAEEELDITEPADEEEEDE